MTSQASDGGGPGVDSGETEDLWKIGAFFHAQLGRGGSRTIVYRIPGPQKLVIDAQ